MEILPPLSTRAIKLLERIKRGAFYRAYDKKTPKAMQELIDAKLVHLGGRVVVIGTYYVANGHTNFVMDRAPNEPKGTHNV